MKSNLWIFHEMNVYCSLQLLKGIDCPALRKINVFHVHHMHEGQSLRVDLEILVIGLVSFEFVN